MRRLRADSVGGMVNAMVEAGLPPLHPPKHVKLRPGDLPFWEGIVHARSRDEWMPADLVVAAQLARCQADIEREQLALDDEDSVVTNERGTRVVNARVAVLEQFARREMALMRSLRMGGVASGKAEDDARRRNIQIKAQRALADVSDEELLAT